MSRLADLDAECLCGAVMLHMDGSPVISVLCHCTICQRCTGSIGELSIGWESQKVSFTRGEDNVGSFNSTEHGVRSFCKTCSSPLLSEVTEGPNMKFIPAGVLQRDGDGVLLCRSDSHLQPSAHIFYRTRILDSFDSDGIPKWSGYPGISERLDSIRRTSEMSAN